MIQLSELIESCKAEALSNRFQPTEGSYWRYFCREYSKIFHTPLPMVMELSPEHVILTVYEESFAKKNLNEMDEYDSLVEEVRRLQDPNFDSNAAKEFDEFVQFAEAQEAERVAKGAPIPKPRSKKQRIEEPKLAKDQNLPPDAPKSGFVDMSRFKQDNES